MQTISIPGTDLQVSEICLGTGGIGSAIDLDTSYRMLDRFVEQGGNFLDSAKVYADWLPGERSSSEKTIGRWLASLGNRDRIVLATKGAHPDLASMHIQRLSRPEIVSDLESSLDHLKIDRIDLYWLHRDDPGRPVGEILETLNELVKAGKIRYFGASNWRTERLEAAQTYAAAHGLQGFAASSTMWNYGVPDPEAIPDKTITVMDSAMWQYHARTGLPAIPYTPQANGLFRRMANSTLEQMKPDQRRIYHLPENPRRFERLMQLSAETGLTVTQIVLGFLLSQPFMTIPIVGCQNLAQLEDSLSAAGVRLSTNQLAFLEHGG
jgi:aryl-alcohol dehydrogenase-like predicted oxidoreductase